MEKHAHPPRVVLLRFIPNTYSIHPVSSLKFAYFQGRLSRHITSPSEKTRPESWPRDYMGKATPFWQLSSPLPPNVTIAELSHSKSRRWKSMLIHQGWFTALYTQHLLDSPSLEFEICIFPREAIPSQYIYKYKISVCFVLPVTHINAYISIQTKHSIYSLLLNTLVQVRTLSLKA